MGHVQIFLSCVSAEFRSYRDVLRRALERPNVSVKVQEDFVAGGGETLEKLDDYIRHCDAVIHLVGDMTGAAARSSGRNAICRRYSNLAERLPALAPCLTDAASALSYTQWEAWLALYHGKPLFIAVPQDEALRDDGHLREDDGCAAQHAHLARLSQAGRYPEISFGDVKDLTIEVLRSTLHDILGQTLAPAALPRAGYAWPKPYDFGDYPREKRERFEGREWLFAKIEAWRAKPQGRALLVEADVGVGKSAIIAELVARNPGGAIAAWHFCQHGTQETLQPGVAVLSLAAQLAVALPAYRRAVDTDPALQERLKRAWADPGSALEGAVLAPLARIAAEPEPRLIVIDALDEALELDAEAARRGTLVTLVASKATRFPRWLKLLVTARPVPGVRDPLAAFGLETIDAERSDNQDDLRRYIAGRAAREPLAERLHDAKTSQVAFTALLLLRSQGKFLYAVHAMQDIENERLSIADLQALAPGMDSFYLESFWRRYKKAGRDYEATRLVLGGLCAAREPVAPALLAEVLGVDVGRVKAVFLALPDFLRLRGGRLSFDHFSMVEWLSGDSAQGWPRGGDFAVDPDASLQRWRAWALAHCQAGDAHRFPYLLRHLAAHLGDAEQRRRVYGELMSTSLDWLEARWQQDGVDALLVDVENLIGAPEYPTLCRVLRHMAPVLRRDPDQWMAQLLGRIGEGVGEAQRLAALGAAARRRLAVASERLGQSRSAWLPTSRSLRLAMADHILRGGESQVIAVLPDGRIVLGDSDGTVRVWDVQRDGETLVLQGHTYAVLALAVLPCGRIVSGGFDGTVRVWEAQRGGEALVLQGHNDRVCALAVLPDGRIVSGSEDGTVRVWDVQRDGRALVLRGHASGVTALAVLPGGHIVSASDDDTVRVWDVQQGGEARVLQGHTSAVRALAVLPDGRIVSSGLDHTVRVWDVQRGGQALVLQGHTNWVEVLGMLPDGRIVSGGTDNTLRVWDVRRGGEALVLQGHSHPVRALAVLPDGRIVSGSDDFAVRVWDVQRGSEAMVLQGHMHRVLALAVLPDGRIVSSSRDKTVRVWEVQRDSGALALQEETRQVRALAVLPDGRIVSSSDDHTVRVWDVQRGDEALVMQGDGWSNPALAVLPDGRVVQSCIFGTVHVWDLQRGGEAMLLQGHTSWVEALAVLPDGRIVSAGGTEHTVEVRDLSGGGKALVLQGHDNRIRALAVLPDGRIASGGVDHTVRVWDVQRGGEALVLQHANPVRALAVLPDGRIVSGSDDQAVRVWDVQQGGEPLLLHGHTGRVRALAVLPDGRIVSGGEDGSVRVWDARNGCQTGYFATDAAVNCLAVADRLIAAGCGDGAVHFLKEFAVP